MNLISIKQSITQYEANISILRKLKPRKSVLQLKKFYDTCTAGGNPNRFLTIQETVEFHAKILWKKKYARDSHEFTLFNCLQDLEVEELLGTAIDKTKKAMYVLREKNLLTLENFNKLFFARREGYNIAEFFYYLDPSLCTQENFDKFIAHRDFFLVFLGVFKQLTHRLNQQRSIDLLLQHKVLLADTFSFLNKHFLKNGVISEIGLISLCNNLLIFQDQRLQNRLLAQNSMLSLLVLPPLPPCPPNNGFLSFLRIAKDIYRSLNPPVIPQNENLDNQQEGIRSEVPATPRGFQAPVYQGAFFKLPAAVSTAPEGVIAPPGGLVIPLST